MKNIKLFTNHSEYEQYINSAGKILPNVSYCLDARDVHYNDGNVEPILRVTYHAGGIKSATETVQLYLYMAEVGAIAENMFSKVVIDGNEVSISDLDANMGTYVFTTDVEHVVEYTLKDPTLIGAVIDQVIEKLGAIFAGCYTIVGMKIPDTVTIIGESALAGTSLENVTIPSGVTDFYEALGAISCPIKLLPTTPPTLHSFSEYRYYDIFVPAESLNAYKTAEGWSEYAEFIYPIGDDGEDSGGLER